MTCSIERITFDSGDPSKNLFDPVDLHPPSTSDRLSSTTTCSSSLLQPLTNSCHHGTLSCKGLERSQISNAQPSIPISDQLLSLTPSTGDLSIQSTSDHTVLDLLDRSRQKIHSFSSPAEEEFDPLLLSLKTPWPQPVPLSCDEDYFQVPASVSSSTDCAYPDVFSSLGSFITSYPHSGSFHRPVNGRNFLPAFFSGLEQYRYLPPLDQSGRSGNTGSDGEFMVHDSKTATACPLNDGIELGQALEWANIVSEGSDLGGVPADIDSGTFHRTGQVVSGIGLSCQGPELDQPPLYGSTSFETKSSNDRRSDSVTMTCSDPSISAMGLTSSPPHVFDMSPVPPTPDTGGKRAVRILEEYSNRLGNHKRKENEANFLEDQAPKFKKSKKTSKCLIEVGSPCGCITECGKQFRRSTGIAQHKLIHDGKKPFGCPIQGCIKRFTTSSNAKRHGRTHKQAIEKKQLETPKQANVHTPESLIVTGYHDEVFRVP